MLAPSNPSFSAPTAVETRVDSSPVRRFIPRPSVNLSQARVLRRIAGELAMGVPTVLVVGSGDQRARVEGAWTTPVRVVCLDIDPQADCDVLGDAADLPFSDGSFDAVVATAVLNVLPSPSAGFREMRRVLRSGGYAYSELSFLQHLWSGERDLWRMTMHGHLRLMREFEVVEHGAVAGPFTVLYWAIEGCALAIVRSARSRLIVKAVLRLALGWISRLDLLAARLGTDLESSASATYVLGRKRSETPPTDENTK